jgi:hypothetical protein
LDTNSPSALPSATSALQEVTSNQGSFDVVGTLPVAQATGSHSAVDLLFAAELGASASHARVVGDSIVLSASDESPTEVSADSNSKASALGSGGDGKVPRGDPCSKANGNPCNGNNGNGGDQGNAGGVTPSAPPPPPPPPPPDAGPPDGVPPGDPCAMGNGNPCNGNNRNVDHQ